VVYNIDRDDPYFILDYMKTTKRLIRLERIVGVLPSVQEAYDCLAGVMPLVRDPEKFSADMCRMMLEIKQPMLVQKGKKYHLISGYREWQLALYKFDKTEKIHCQIVTDVSDSLLNEIAWHYAYGAALLYGISPKRMGQQCNQMVTKVRQEIKDKYFPELASIRQFAKSTDISRASFYLAASKKESKKGTFDELLRGFESE
jgi:hypothetical protein